MFACKPVYYYVSKHKTNQQNFLSFQAVTQLFSPNNIYVADLSYI